MTELEEICMMLDENVKQKVLASRKLLNSLPEHPYGNYSKKWGRCLLTCQLCGSKDPSYHVADYPSMWCTKCGKMTYWKVTHKLV